MTQMTPFDEMDRLFDQMRRAMWNGRPLGESGGSNVRLEAGDEGYLVHADVPGFETEEIDLRFEDGLLTVEASHETEDDDGFRSRRVHEQVRVPGDVVVEDIEASYNNGVLEVSLPTATDVETGHRIDID